MDCKLWMNGLLAALLVSPVLAGGVGGATTRTTASAGGGSTMRVVGSTNVSAKVGVQTIGPKENHVQVLNRGTGGGQ